MTGVQTCALPIYGTMIFQQLYEFGLGLNIDPRVMDRIRFRGFQYFTKAFLLPNWILENGNSFGSFRLFLKELRKFDRRLPYAALSDGNTMTQFLFYGTPVYQILKRIYMKYRAWSYDKQAYK